MTSKPKLCGVISIKIILVTNIWEYLQEFNRLYKVVSFISLCDILNLLNYFK